jgi:DNA-binding MarR family transcriptional regulator
VRWLDPREQRAWRAWTESTRLLLVALDRQLVADTGVSFTDYELLVRLSEAPGRSMRMSALADATLATRSGCTRAVTRLAAAGSVERSGDVSDGRGTVATLTDAGLAALQAAAPGHVEAVRAGLIDLMTPAELAIMTSIGERVRDRLGRRPVSGD